MSPKKGATVALVVRVSRVGGRNGERFQSPGDQIAAATERAVKAGFKVKIFDADSEGQGVSGATPYDERPGMGEALRMIEEGELCGLVVAAQDRLVRKDRNNSGGPTLAQMQKRAQAGGFVLLIADNSQAEVTDSDDEIATGYAAAGSDVRELADQWVREESQKRWKRARRNAVARGVHVSSRVAVGYDRNEREPQKPVTRDGPADRGLTPKQRFADPVVGQLVPNEDAKAIAEVFRRRIAGASRGELASYLESEGVRTSKGGRGGGGRAGWSVSGVAFVLQNRAYMGWASSGEFINEAAHMPIIDEGTWLGAQAPKATREWKAKGSLLAKTLTCAGCGRHLTAHWSKRAGIKSCAYVCLHRPCEGRASIAHTRIEPYVIEAMLEHFNGETVAKIGKTTPDVERLEAEAARLKVELDACRSLSVAAVGVELFASMVAERRTAYEKAATASVEAVAKLAPTPEGRTRARLLKVKDLDAMKAEWEGIELGEKRRLIAQAFPLIVVRKGRAEKVEDRVELTRFRSAA
jgi:hypothetical protein